MRASTADTTECVVRHRYHTIIPGMATVPNAASAGGRDLYCAFGVMGGFMQPQGHMQVISNMVDFGWP